MRYQLNISWLTYRNLGCDRDLEVDLRHVEDLPGAGGVLQRRERLLQVDGGRRHRRDDRRLCLAAQRVLQQPRQLGLPGMDGKVVNAEFLLEF